MPQKCCNLIRQRYKHYGGNGEEVANLCDQYLCLNLLSASLNCILPRLDPGAFENFNELVLQITQKERCRSIACLKRLKLISLWQHNS